MKGGSNTGKLSNAPNVASSSSGLLDSDCVPTATSLIARGQAGRMKGRLPVHRTAARSGKESQMPTLEQNAHESGRHAQVAGAGTKEVRLFR